MTTAVDLEDDELARRRARDAARKRRRRAELVGRPRFPDELAAPMSAELVDAVTVDRKPSGYTTPAGPSEGRSTSFEDLAVELDELAARAAAHPWWRAHGREFAEYLRDA